MTQSHGTQIKCLVCRSSFYNLNNPLKVKCNKCSKKERTEEKKLEKKVVEKVKFNKSPSVDARISNAPDKIAWTKEQLEIIESDPSSQILVDAGPGTGKTTVACQKLVHLIQEYNVKEESICFLSYTNVAVNEIMPRLQNTLTEAEKVKIESQIMTIDKWAYSIREKVGGKSKVQNTYDENIKQLTEEIKINKEYQEAIRSNIKHLIIDEAQDIYGVRTDFILAVIKCLGEDTGFTIFYDAAQAIYGHDEDEEQASFSNLPAEIIKHQKNHFQSTDSYQLDTIHRTNNPQLIRLFSEGRTIVNSKKSGRDQIKQIMKLIKEISLDENIWFDDDTDFILFRKRSEAMNYVAKKIDEKATFRLRMGNTPYCIIPEIGIIFWDFVKDKITENEFLERWDERVANSKKNKTSVWLELLTVAKATNKFIKIDTLRKSLLKASQLRIYAPEIVTNEFGFEGPTIGTIHGAKGRERLGVRLYLRRDEDWTKWAMTEGSYTDDTLRCEARTIFVGATRVKEDFSYVSYTDTFLKRESTKAMKLDNGRCWTPLYTYTNKKNVKFCNGYIQLGHEADFDMNSLVGSWEKRDILLTGQKELIDLFGTSVENLLKKEFSISEDQRENQKNLYELWSNDSIFYGYCSEALNKDINDFGIALRNKEKYFKDWTSPKIKNSRMGIIGIRTMVIDDSLKRNELHSPWSESGFCLAPCLIGFPEIQFNDPHYKGK